MELFARLPLAPCVTSSAPVRCSGLLVALASKPPTAAIPPATAAGTDNGAAGAEIGWSSLLKSFNVVANVSCTCAVVPENGM